MTTTEPEGADAASRAGATAAELVRSEEQLRVSTRTEVSGRVRVRKLVTSEEVTQTLTLRREELSVEHLPAGTGPDDGGHRLAEDADGEEIELVLHEERVVVTRVPVERVRVRVHRVTEAIDVSEIIRRERIDFDVAPAAPAGTES
jgi:uncharacterized protein (TIGR02271 family)